MILGRVPIRTWKQKTSHEATMAAGCRTVGVEEGSPRANARCLVQHLEIPQKWVALLSTEVGGTSVALPRLTMADTVEISCRKATVPGLYKPTYFLWGHHLGAGKLPNHDELFQVPLTTSFNSAQNPRTSKRNPHQLRLKPVWTVWIQKIKKEHPEN